MYYGFRCYNQEGKPMGWLYTAHQESELNWTDNPIYFNWCKRWKTEQGAKKNFNYYQQRWQFYRQGKGGYLQIEMMPESSKDTQNRSSQQKWDADHPDIIKKAKVEYDNKNPVWSFRPTSELREWLEQERWDDDGKSETNAQLVIRKLNKLKKLESQGY